MRGHAATKLHLLGQWHVGRGPEFADLCCVASLQKHVLGDRISTEYS